MSKELVKEEPKFKAGDLLKSNYNNSIIKILGIKESSSKKYTISHYRINVIKSKTYIVGEKQDVLCFDIEKEFSLIREPKFKVGDIVICIKDGNYCKVGDIDVIEKVLSNTIELKEDFIYGKDYGLNEVYLSFEEHFKLYKQEYKKEKEIMDKFDKVINEAGRKAIFDEISDSVYMHNNDRIFKEKDFSYEEWKTEPLLRMDTLPRDVSYNEALEYFDKEIKHEYDMMICRTEKILAKEYENKMKEARKQQYKELKKEFGKAESKN